MARPRLQVLVSLGVEQLCRKGDVVGPTALAIFNTRLHRVGKPIVYDRRPSRYRQSLHKRGVDEAAETDSNCEFKELLPVINDVLNHLLADRTAICGAIILGASEQLSG